MKKKLKKLKHIYVLRFENCKMSESSESVESFLKQYFSASFSDRFLEKVVDTIPLSQFIASRVEQIDEVEELWRRAPNLVGNGDDPQIVLSQELQKTFGLSDEDLDGKSWLEVAIDCFDLGGLSRAHNGTSFIDVYDNERFEKKLTEFWRKLLLDLPGFQEQLSCVLTAKKKYEQSAQNVGHDESEGLFEDYLAELRILQTFSDEADEKLKDVKESGLISSDDFQYFDLLTQLGITFQEVEPESESESDSELEPELSSAAASAAASTAAASPTAASPAASTAVAATAAASSVAAAASSTAASSAALDQQIASLQQQMSDLQQQLAELLAQKKP